MESTIDLQGGTVEVAGEQVIVRYSLSGGPRTVVFDVLPTRSRKAKRPPRVSAGGRFDEWSAACYGSTQLSGMMP